MGDKKKELGLVFEGGGAKGIAYIPALELLEQYKDRYKITAVAGASAGAITAALVASGISAAALKEKMPSGLETLGKQLERQGWLYSPLRKQLRTTGGAFENGTLGAWLVEELGDDTFQTFYKRTRIELFLTAANVSLRELIIFHHKLTPKCRVVDAVLASSAIPGAFQSSKLIVQHEVEINAEEKKRGGAAALPMRPRIHTLVDGGVWANYPDFVFNDPSFRAFFGLEDPPDRVVGFLLQPVDLEVTDDGFPGDAATLGSCGFTLYRESKFASGKNAERPQRYEAQFKAKKAPLLIQYLFLGLMIGALLGYIYLAINQAPLLHRFGMSSLFCLSLIVGYVVTQAGAGKEDHGWPRARPTKVYDGAMVFLGNRSTALFGLALIVLFLLFGIDASEQAFLGGQFGWPMRLVGLFFGFILIPVITLLVLALIAAVFVLADVRRALDDWAYGLGATFVSGAGAPKWRGCAKDDRVVRIPIPKKDLDTLTFLAHKKKVGPDKEDFVKALFNKVHEVINDQLKKALAESQSPDERAKESPVHDKSRAKKSPS